jgi:branched-chain amino acid aminotransferase
LIENNALCTPPIASGLLPGVTRSVILELAAALSVATRESNAGLETLRKADGMFMSLTSRGVMEVHKFDAQPLGASPITAKIRHAYEELLQNETANCER